MKPLYNILATWCRARHNCIDNGNTEWEERWEKKLLQAVKSCMISGSGFDSGTCIDLEKSSSNKLVFYTSFHHVNDVGMYDGWTEHTVVVRALLTDINILVKGKNRNDICDYIHEVFYDALMQQYDEHKEFP